jgi:hypothetical protein
MLEWARIGLRIAKVEYQKDLVCAPCRHGKMVAACLRFKTVLKFAASLRVTWCLFHQGGSSLDLSIQGSEANH